jgi:CDP-glucose 4,6-dehydratase
LKKASVLNREFYAGKRVLVTGHTGFKGSWLTAILHELGAVSRGLALAPVAGSLFEKIGGASLIDHVECDIRDVGAVKQAVRDFQPEIVIHLAAQAIVKDCFDDPERAYSTNVLGTVNLLEAVRGCEGVKSVLIVTTDKVYENKGDGAVYAETDPLGGVDPYSASKTCMEVIAASYRDSYLLTGEKSVGVATVRASNVLAGGDHVQSRLIPSILGGFAAGKPVELRNPNQTRPWQSVFDAMNGYLTIARKLYEEPARFSEAWNIGPSVDGIRTVADVFRIMQKYFDDTVPYDEGKKFEVRESQTLGLSIDKAVERLGWRPEQPLQKMLYDVVDYFKRQRAGEAEISICRRQIRDYFQLEG